MMNSQELETAVRMKLDLVVLILNDSAYGMIRWKQNQMGFEDFGLGFNNPCFSTYARSYGATGHRIERAADFRPCLEESFGRGGVHLIDAAVDYSECGKILNEEIPRECAALASSQNLS